MSEAAFDSRRELQTVRNTIYLGAAVLGVLYAFSGVSVIAPGEVAVVRRLGSWLRDDERVRLYPPGLVWAFPAPIDETITIPVSQERTLRISAANERTAGEPTMASESCITGDNYLLSPDITIKFRVQNPAEFVECSPNTEQLLKPVLHAALITTLNRWSVDEALRTRRLSGDTTSADADLATDILNNAAGRLAPLRTGVELASIEIGSVKPPAELIDAFEAVQSARVEQETWREEARGEARDETIGAEGMAAQIVAESQGNVSKRLAQATSEAIAFKAALTSVEKSTFDTAVERLRRETWDSIARTSRKLYFMFPDFDGVLHLSVETAGGDQ